MRIVIDFQGAQGSSRGRGIGRYSVNLVEAMLKFNEVHEIYLLLNSSLGSDWGRDFENLTTLIPFENIKFWTPLKGETKREREISESLRAAIIDSLQPDFILVTSLFEGLGESAVISVPQVSRYKQAVILYDLIPLKMPEIYLTESRVRDWYMGRIGHLLAADVLLAISQASKEEAQEVLGLIPKVVFNISSAADSKFTKTHVKPGLASQLKHSLKISKGIVLYTGGDDFRKNVEGLIRAFALLPQSLRETHQLVIVCRVEASGLSKWRAVQEAAGLRPVDVVFTGFVSDEDLVLLYNLADVFIFPSFREGFGLPVLEAMQSGTATIASNSSSLPEIIDRADALFDPNNEYELATLIEKVLCDPLFRADLEAHGLERAASFTWEKTARNVFGVLEEAIDNPYANRNRAGVLENQSSGMPKKTLAFFSPLPPEKSGISEYSITLLGELSKLYDIAVVSDRPLLDKTLLPPEVKVLTTEEFQDEARNFDRIVYQIGNSEFHADFEALNEKYPGVVVLHDFFIGGLHHFISSVESNPSAWLDHLFGSHGYGALKRAGQTADVEALIEEYPTNLLLLQNALGVIVHSETARKMARTWYGDYSVGSWSVISLPRKTAEINSLMTSKASSSSWDNQRVLCAFGFLSDTKYVTELVHILGLSEVFRESNAIFYFVGEAPSALMREVNRLVAFYGLENKITVTGWVSQDEYHKYLHAADICVQLRRGSRGETSAALLDALGAGAITFASDGGTAAELPDDLIIKVQEPLVSSELKQKLEMVLMNFEEFAELSRRAADYIREKHSPQRCAAQYFESIEKFYSSPQVPIFAIAEGLSGLGLSHLELTGLAQAVNDSYPPTPRRRKILLDIGTLEENDNQVFDSLEQEFGMIFEANSPWDVQPIFFDEVEQRFVYARRRFAARYHFAAVLSVDSTVDFYPGDSYIRLSPIIPQEANDDFALRSKGVEIKDRSFLAAFGVTQI